MVELYQLLYPMRVVLITSKHGEKENVMTAAWCYPLSVDPPLFGVSISRKRFSYGLISKGKAFGINLVDKSMQKAVLGAGNTSGRDRDKFTDFNLKKEYGKLGIPLLKDSPVSAECKVLKEIEIGDHVLFVGEIVNTVKRRTAKGLYDIGKDEEEFIEV
jgi:flavin reductase (DIM6/NTAB) family NADH-FMN oxidoreductase RutF